MNPFDWIFAVLALVLLALIARTLYLHWRYVGGISPKGGGSHWTIAYYVVCVLMVGALVAGGHGSELVDALLGRER